MSITQGLAELKLLDKRINKCLGYTVNWAQLRSKINKVDEVELKKTAQSEYQSYMDLVKRRDTIKRAIVLSNAQTQVTIGTGPKKWSGTVAEAIEHKSSLTYKKNLLEKMIRNIHHIDEEYKGAMEALEKRLDGLLTSELGKDVKTNPETITALRASFMETNKVELVDPMDLKKIAKELEEEIDAFETNVDWVLSESNGKTMISLDEPKVKVEFTSRPIPKVVRTYEWNSFDLPSLSEIVELTTKSEGSEGSTEVNDS
jgi:hypothetical protein